MNHTLLKTILLDQHEVIRNAQIIPRAMHFDPAANYVLTGLRRAGKSTLLYQRARELAAQGVDWKRIIYINFEDERLGEFTVKDFNDLLLLQSEWSSEKGYFFLDEVQNIPGWEKFARRMADSGERVYITGSNARMLSRDIATTLGGRYFVRHVTPYRFDEYLTAQGIPFDESALLQTKANGRIRAACAQYMVTGGFPEALRYTEKREYLSGVYQKILLGDMVARNGLRNEYAVRLVLKKIAETVCSEVSYSKLHGTMKAIGVSVGKDSIIDYIGYAKDAYLLFSLQNFTASFSDKESTPRYYFGDNGLLGLFLARDNAALLENAAALALTERYPEGVFYLKSAKTGINLDFYVPDAGLAVQAAWSIAGPARRRETDALKRLAAADSSLRRLLIVTLEETETIQEDGVTIEAIPLHRFLLEMSR